MEAPGTLLIGLGGLFLLGLATDFLGRASALPRVTLLMLTGIALGAGGLDLLPASVVDGFPLVTDMALSLVGFLLGGRLTREGLAAHGREVLWISASVVGVTALVVAGGLWLAGVPPALALLFGGIATATDPAATADVVRQYRARGPFTDTLGGIVAIDDAWGLVAFSVLLALASFVLGSGDGASVLLGAGRELAGSLLLGVAIGVPAAYLTGRLREGEPTLVEALGVVFLCAGLAERFELSFLLAAMTLGATVANLARHHERPFHEIEDIEWPFLMLFFVLTGAALELDGVGGVFELTALYIALRSLGRVLGSWPGGWLARAQAPARRWMGFAMLPQAGVANGMALVAGNAFPPLRDTLLAVTILATVAFELGGPFATRVALGKAGEIGSLDADHAGDG